MSPPEPFTVISRVPIPASVPPSAVLEALQKYDTLITPNPYLDRFEQRPIDDGETKDPFFIADGWNLQGFIVYERVPIIPGVGAWATKEVAIPCVFQSFEHGVRCCGHAQGGVTVRSSYEVRRRGEVTEGPASEVRPGDGDYELVDISNIECGLLVKPFVKMRLSSGHQALMEQLVGSLVESTERQADAAQPVQTEG